MPHVIGLTIGRATSSPSNDVPAKHTTLYPFHLINMGVSKNRGTPKWMVKIMENPMNKWMIWGKTPLFLETPTYHFSLHMSGQLRSRSRRPAQDQMGDETSASHKALT